MSNDQPLITFCFNANNQLWEQDMWNNQMFNRLLDVKAEHHSQVFPRPEPTINRVKFVIDKNVPKTQSSPPLKNIDTESTLIFTNNPLTKDCLSLTDAQNLHNNKSLHLRQLYRDYHSHEVNFSSYPDFDTKIFDNTTKEIYKCEDFRNQFSIDPLISFHNETKI